MLKIVGGIINVAAAGLVIYTAADWVYKYGYRKGQENAFDGNTINPDELTEFTGPNGEKYIAYKGMLYQRCAAK